MLNWQMARIYEICLLHCLLFNLKIYVIYKSRDPRSRLFVCHVRYILNSGDLNVKFNRTNIQQQNSECRISRELLLRHSTLAMWTLDNHHLKLALKDLSVQREIHCPWGTIWDERVYNTSSARVFWTGLTGSTGFKNFALTNLIHVIIPSTL